MIYVGQTRSSSLIARLAELGFGEMTVREEVPPRRTPWAFDNGAYRDWTAARAFDAERFTAALDVAMAQARRPDFVVAPDIVAGGVASLDFSLRWAERLAGLGVRHLYLAVQDGMTQEHLDGAALQRFTGLFVGGTLAWKLRTGEAWTRYAHRLGKRCHIGRVGTPNRLRWATRIGADPIDSCLPLWSEENLDRFVRALGKGGTMEMFSEAPYGT